MDVLEGWDLCVRDGGGGRSMRECRFVQGWKMGMQRALTNQVWVINLYVAETSIIQNLQLSTVCLRDISKVLGVGSVDLLGVSPARLVAQMVPVRRRERELGLGDLFSREDALQVLPLRQVGAADVLDLTGADDRLAGLVAALSEGGYVGYVHAEDVDVDVGHLLEAVESGEEGAPVRVSSAIVIIVVRLREIVVVNVDCVLVASVCCCKCVVGRR